MIYLSMNNAYTGKLLAARKIEKADSLKKHTITSRTGKMLLRHDNTLHTMVRIAKDCLPSISLVHPATDSTEVELMVGAYMHENPGGAYVMGGVLAGAIGGAVVAITVQSIKMTRGHYHYFFTRPNSNRSFDFVSGSNSLSANAKIDRYEIVQKEQYAMRFDVKDYLKTPDGAIGLYYATETNTIRIVEFRPELQNE